jgi:hypothetical protein
MSDRTGLGDSPVAIFAVLWIVAVGVLVGGAFRDEPDGPAAPTPEPSPVPRPAAIVFGSDVDPITGEVADAGQQFDPGSTLALSAWLGEPIGVSEVTLELFHLLPDGGNQLLWDERPLDVDGERYFISAVFSTDELIDEVGRGSFRLRIISAPDDVLGIGTFRLAVDQPSAIDAFAAPLPVEIPAGDHTIQRFDLAGDVVDQRTENLDEPALGAAARRAVYGGQPYLYLVGDPWDGYWILESAVALADG